MTDELGEKIHDIETPGLNNRENYVLMHNRFNTYMVLNFSDLNKSQVYKVPYRVSPHHEIEIVTKLNYLNVLKTIEHTED